MRPGLLTLALGVTTLAACGPDAPSLELNFPSLETFLYSSFARVDVFDVSPNELGMCPSLIRESLRGSTSRPPVYETGDVSVCDFRDGGVVMTGAGSGPKAFVAVVSDASNHALLTGCAVTEVYEGSPSITIRLFMTDRYHEIVDALGPLECGSIDDKCERGCGG
jgi:hypothetical protein